MDFPSGIAVKIVAGIISVFRKVYDFIRKWLFHETWQISHRAWLARYALGSKWVPLGDDIDVSISLARSREGPKVSRIALRSRGRKFDALTVVVEAFRGNVIFDETRIVSGLESEMRILMLPAFPIYSINASEERGIWSSYDDYCVRITSLTENGVAHNVDLRTQRYTPLSLTLVHPHHWIVFEGKLVNIGEIVWAKDRIRSRFWRMVRGERYSHEVKLYQRVAAAVVLCKPIIDIWFWFPHAVLRRKFEPERNADDAAPQGP